MVPPAFLCYRASLLFFTQKDVKQKTCYHQYYCSNQDTVVVLKCGECADNNQDCAQNNQESSQISFKTVHCYIVLFVFFSGVQIKWILSE